MSDEKQFQEWLDSNKEAGERIKESAVYAGMVTDNFLKNPRCALQLGYAILMDKPIILMVDKDTKISASLTKIAKVIERVDFTNQDDLARAGRTIQEFAAAQVNP